MVMMVMMVMMVNDGNDDDSYDEMVMMHGNDDGMVIRHTVCLIPYKGWIPLVGNGPNTGVFIFNIVPLTF